MSTSAQILAIRAKAGNPNTQCPTCCHPPGAPWRVYSSEGKILYGCVDAIHTGHLVPISESARWHAKGEHHRKCELAHLLSLGPRRRKTALA